MSATICGKAYVVSDNIDTDQIIPAQYLALVPTIADEYKQLGVHALCGLPVDQYPDRMVNAANGACEYKIIIAGRNFGCGSSREHAPIAMGAAGIACVIAETFARIFYRNAISTGELYPIECVNRICDQIKTGDELEVDLDELVIRRPRDDARFSLVDPGEVRKVVAAGGLFEYARATGLVPQRSASK